MPLKAVATLLLLAALSVAAMARDVLVRTFPPDAHVSIEAVGGGRRRLGSSLEADGWRRFTVDCDSCALVLSAAGYKPRYIHLGDMRADPGTTLRIEERLETTNGPLVLMQEVPSGPSPKAVAFLPGGGLAVTQLRGRGLSIYDDDLRHATLEVPPDGGGASGFVELAVLPGRSELWVSQMNTNAVHVLTLDGPTYRGTVPSGGGWPKVLEPSPDEREMYVANWEGRSVGVIDTDLRELVSTIPVSGEPRGLAVTPDGRHLWVCLFDSGAVEIIDTATRTVVHRIERGRGAARHIVVSRSGATMYLSDMLRGSVEIIDVASRTTVRTRRVGINVNTIALSPDGRFLFVSERGRNNPESYLLNGPEFGRIIVLDADTLETVQEIWGRHQPTGLAVNAAGTLLAATDFLDDNVAIYALASQ